MAIKEEVSSTIPWHIIVIVHHISTSTIGCVCKLAVEIMSNGLKSACVSPIFGSETVNLLLQLIGVVHLNSLS